MARHDSSISNHEVKDLHILKELDQDLINKILSIAEDGDKKYVINNQLSEQYQIDAQ